jgi:MinD-like ATPase involved in chromosome partitioning or flagellar assembly
MMALGSQGIFVLHYPEHPITKELKQLAHMLLA